MKIIFSVCYWLFVVITCLIMFIPALMIWLATVLIDKRLRLLHLYSCLWASMYIFFNPFWRLRIEGRRKIKNPETCVMISNHQSILDILVLYSLFRHFKWVSKIENFRLPVVGWNMSLNRYIRLDRQSSRSVLKMIRDAEKSLSEGNSVMIFPEGTRSLDNHFRAFKEGAFVITLRSKKPILPIVLHGTGDSIPKKGFILRKNSNIRVRVLDPIPYESYSGMTPAELSRSMRDLMSLAHEELKNETS